MTHYRLKQDLPGCAAGTLFTVVEPTKDGGLAAMYQSPDEKVYLFSRRQIVGWPNWFEEVKEQSDVELMASWLHSLGYGLFGTRDPAILAQHCLDYGLDVDRIRKERKGKWET